MDIEGVRQSKGAADTDGWSGEIENANAEAYRGQTCSSSLIIDNKPAEEAGLVHF